MRFDFDARQYQPSTDEVTPLHYATRLWVNHTTYPNELTDPQEALWRAQSDPEVWDALLLWAKNSREQLTDRWKAALFDLLLDGRPVTRKGLDMTTVFRDQLLCAIGRRLHEEFGLPYAQSEAGGNTPCVAGVLAGLGGLSIGEEQVKKLLSAGAKHRK
jgi:hypothetical protein